MDMAIKLTREFHNSSQDVFSEQVITQKSLLHRQSQIFDIYGQVCVANPDAHVLKEI